MQINLKVMQSNNKNEMLHKSRLMLHVLFLHKCYEYIDYISQKLDIDKNYAEQILDHFKHTFSVDDPLTWLLNFQEQTKKHCSLKYHNKEKILDGFDVTNKPEDTAEYRKLKLRSKLLDWFKKTN